MKAKKKIIIPVAVVLVVALVLGSVFTLMRANRDPVAVYAVNELTTENYGGNLNYCSAQVRTDNLQTVYLTETQQVTKIVVTEGQQVRKGDALLNFDTSLSDLQLKRKDIEVQQLERELKDAKQEYNTLVGKQFYRLAEATPIALNQLSANGAMPALRLLNESKTENPSEPSEEEEEPPMPIDEETGLPGVKPDEDGKLLGYYCNGGDGLKDSPFSYYFVDAIPFEKPFFDLLLQIVNEKQQPEKEIEAVYVIFTKTDDDTLEGEEIGCIGVCYNKNGKFTMFDPDAKPTPETQPTEKPVPPTEPTEPTVKPTTKPTTEPTTEPTTRPTYYPSYYPTPSYYEPTTSPEESALRKQELQDLIKDLDLQIRMAKVEYKAMQQELGDGTIYAEIDGTVTGIGDPATAYIENAPIVKISGGGGYYLEGSVSELLLNAIHEGQTVTINAYQSGTTCEGKIISVSNFPAENSFGYSGGDSNSNVTYYGYTVFVDETADLQASEYVEMTFELDTGSLGDSLYLQKPFVLQENGKCYIFVRGEKGLLEKREVKTGEELWGSYVAIDAGSLTNEDFIAFPYAKGVEDGAKTVEKSIETLY